MADFRPVEAVKARILNIRAAQATTTIEDANAEWIEVQAALDSDLANWRLQHLRALWREEIRKPVEWEWVYTWGSPSFVRAGEIYRIHSGSRVRAATHPLADDLVGGRKHVYAAGPIAEGDYLGISRSGIETVAPTLAEACTGLLAKLLTDDHEIVTLCSFREKEFHGVGLMAVRRVDADAWLPAD